jgi:hypothetical protein
LRPLREGWAEWTEAPSVVLHVRCLIVFQIAQVVSETTHATRVRAEGGDINHAVVTRKKIQHVRSTPITYMKNTGTRSRGAEHIREHEHKRVKLCS